MSGNNTSNYSQTFDFGIKQKWRNLLDDYILCNDVLKNHIFEESIKPSNNDMYGFRYYTCNKCSIVIVVNMVYFYSYTNSGKLFTCDEYIIKNIIE